MTHFQDDIVAIITFTLYKVDKILKAPICSNIQNKLFEVNFFRSFAGFTIVLHVNAGKIFLKFWYVDLVFLPFFLRIRLLVGPCVNLWLCGRLRDIFVSSSLEYTHQHRRSQDFWLGGAQTTNHMQWRHQKFSKKEVFVGQRYRRMEDLKL